jgi:Lar family restriction alleviation protein
MNRYNLHQCPFCAGEMLEIVTTETGDHVVLCGDCQASGPAATDNHDAAVFWNQRDGIEP